MPGPRAHLALATALMLSAAAGAATAQSRPFLYSVQPGRGFVYGDFGYGRNLFAAIGPEKLEHQAGAQFALSHRITLLAHVGLARDRASVGAEVLTSLTPSAGRTILAVGLGGGQDYRRSLIVRGRIVAGYTGAHTRFVGNLNLEKPVRTGPGDSRDAIDVITTLGLSHDLTPALRLGAEAIAEDLEGLFEADEAEGGARLMLGPSIGLGSRASRWNVTVVAGPVVQLTHSTLSGVGSGATRELRSGYVLRTSLSYGW